MILVNAIFLLTTFLESIRNINKNNERLTPYKIYSANVSIIEYLEQILVTCTSDKYELACPADSHAAQFIRKKKDAGRVRRFRPHAAPRATNLIQTRWQQLEKCYWK